MKSRLGLICILIVAVFLFGCTVRAYRLTKERVDQELEGNRGYIKGNPAEVMLKRKPTRTIQQIEIELQPPIKFEKVVTKKKTVPKTEDKQLWGNLGYVEKKPAVSETKLITPPSVVSMEKYTVEKNDTLQKISKKFYGSSRLWYKIYEANKDTISNPNKIYPGQVINIPREYIPKESEKQVPSDLK